MKRSLSREKLAKESPSREKPVKRSLCREKLAKQNLETKKPIRKFSLRRSIRCAPVWMP